MTKLLATLLAGSLAVAGCGKKSDTTPTAENKSAGKPADPKPADKPADPPTNGVTIASDDDYLARAKPMGQRLIDTFKNNGKDCDKLGAEMTKLVADPEVGALRAYEKTHPDVEKKLDAQGGKDMEKEFEAAAAPALQGCQGNKQLMDAIDKLSK